MLQEFIDKYSDNKEMLLKILTTMCSEMLFRYDNIAKKDNINEFSQGKMTAWNDLLDYFDIDFLEENLDDLYNHYVKKKE